MGRTILGSIPCQFVPDLEVRAASQDGQAQAPSPTTEGYYWVYTNSPLTLHLMSGCHWRMAFLGSNPHSSLGCLPSTGAIAGIVDQPMQNFQRTSEASMGHKAKGVISGVGKGIMGVLTKPIGGAAELVSQTGYGELGEATSCSYSTLISLAPKPASPSLTEWTGL